MSGPKRPADLRVSVVIVTYRREQILIDTIRGVAAQLSESDEILVVDQTAMHERETTDALQRLAAEGAIRWIRRGKPHRCEAMNIAALMAVGDVLLFLDDDVIPHATLVAAHRRAFQDDPTLPATSGQVLQPWHHAPVQQVEGFDVRFDFAYDRPCDVLPLMGCNFAVRRHVYLEIGGMDENFSGSNYRDDAEMGYRIFSRCGRRARFVPAAGLRHIHASGGIRAFGGKDTWGHIGGSIGDYYFALVCLPVPAALKHVTRRLVRAPLNRSTVRRPWRVASLAAREVVALSCAAWRVAWHRRRAGVMRSIDSYELTSVSS
jgi:glycosyltransferase involved in cell wall biosynthesis